MSLDFKSGERFYVSACSECYGAEKKREKKLRSTELTTADGGHITGSVRHQSGTRKKKELSYNARRNWQECKRFVAAEEQLTRETSE